ncbi:hypothetical protein Tco_1370204 [Tanacetum coccineum]
MECQEREVAAQEYRARQKDIRFYLQPYDHLTGEQRMSMDEARAAIKTKQALGVVRLSLAKNVAYNVVNEKTAYGLFKALSNMYEKPSASNKVFLIRQLVNMKMKEGASISNHVNDFN